MTAEGAPGAPRATTSIWETGGTSAFGEAVPGEEEAAGPRGRAFFRAGNPGDLVIIQTPEVHEQIEALLRELRKAMNIQVAVESRYLELSNNYVQEVGFDWPDIDFSPGAAAAAGNNAAADNNAADNDATGNNAAVAEAKDLTFRTGLPFFGEAAGSGMMLNWTLSIFDSLKITSLFRAAQQDERSKTLSAPRIVLMNAQRGHLTIETSQNYMSGLTTGQGTFQPEISTIASAVSLDVRPIVSADRRYVFLELAPVVSDVLGFDTFTFTSPGGGGGGGDSGNNAAADNGPVTNQIRLPRQVSQTFETTVCVPDRGVLMVGGQTRHQIAQIEHGTPILNKIPIIKRLFTAEGTSNTRSMLLILVRPQIIILQEEEEAFY